MKNRIQKKEKIQSCIRKQPSTYQYERDSKNADAPQPTKAEKC